MAAHRLQRYAVFLAGYTYTILSLLRVKIMATLMLYPVYLSREQI